MELLAYQLCFLVFYQGTVDDATHSRSIAHGIQAYYDTFSFPEGDGIPFVSYLPHDALALAFAIVSHVHFFTVACFHRGLSQMPLVEAQPGYAPHRTLPTKGI
jgi:hypothetical protein